ncbi:hypothetical protein BKA65DRAFT_470888 [Rhexocercosporidium sp. MPI-PUGE-AT-0058]|nr:hypothetical protein BKA65DRAFT_470888 [Rhexocercosporidium sp. MPI-PUGE-AT-0058]
MSSSRRSKYPSDWSEWEELKPGPGWSRYRLTAKDVYEWDYSVPQSGGTENAEAEEEGQYDNSAGSSRSIEKVSSDFGQLQVSANYQNNSRYQVPQSFSVLQFTGVSQNYQVLDNRDINVSLSILSASGTSTGVFRDKQLESRSKYKRVKVHMMMWKNETSRCKCGPELKKLKDVLIEDFGVQEADSTHFEIPDKDTTKKTCQSVDDVLSDCSQEDLLIFYYGGHGVEPVRGEDWEISGSVTHQIYTREGQSRQMKWKQVHSKLKKSKADILLLLDCCYAAEATRDVSKKNHLLIAACNENQKTSSPPREGHPEDGDGEHTFTAALIYTLRILGKDGRGRENFSAFAIHEGIKKRIRDLRSRLDDSGNKVYRKWVSGMHTPVLRTLLGESAHKDITLVEA